MSHLPEIFANKYQGGRGSAWPPKGTSNLSQWLPPGNSLFLTDKLYNSGSLPCGCANRQATLDKNFSLDTTVCAQKIFCMICIHSPLPFSPSLSSLSLKNNAFNHLVLRPYLFALPFLVSFSAAEDAMAPMKPAWGYLTDQSLNCQAPGPPSLSSLEFCLAPN